MPSQHELLQDLESRDKSIRLRALTAVLEGPSTDELFSGLIRLARRESDYECYNLVFQALETLYRKKTSSASSLPAVPDFASFLERYSAGDAATRLSLLSSVPADFRSPMETEAPRLLAGEENPFVGAALIRAFSQTWPQDQTEILVKQLYSSHMTLQTAAMEALLKIAPAKLEQVLPEFLVSRDPVPRLLAIRGLCRIDPEEAMRHLESLLTQGTCDQKTLALKDIYHFPFDLVKPLLLNFLATETNPDLIMAAGFHFQVNPDSDVPYRLYEIYENADARRKILINPIIQGACRAIQTSGMTAEDFDQYVKALQTWAKKRAAMTFVRTSVLPNLTNPDIGIEHLEKTLQKQIDHPFVFESLEEVLSWPMKFEHLEAFKGLLYQIRRNPVPDPAPAPASDPAPAPDPDPGTGKRSGTVTPVVALPPLSAITTPATAASTNISSPAEALPPARTPAPPGRVPPAIADALLKSCPRLPDLPVATSANTEEGSRESPPAPPESPTGELPTAAEMDLNDRIRKILRYSKKEFQKNREVLTFLLQDPDSQPELKAAILRTLARLRIEGFLPLAEKYLMESDHSDLSAASLEYIEKFNLLGILNKLEAFLESTDQVMKLVSVRILKRLDPIAAVNYFTDRLLSNDTNKQAAALSSLFHFDFALVRRRVYEFLLKSQKIELFQIGMCLFEANPDMENLYLLYLLEKFSEGEAADLARKARRNNERFLTDYQLLDPRQTSDREAKFYQRMVQEKAKMADTRKPYSLKALQSSSESSQVDGTPGLVAKMLNRIGLA